MLYPSLQLKNTQGFEIKKLRRDLTQIINLRQIHIKSVISAASRSKRSCKYSPVSSLFSGCSYPFTL